MLDRTKPGRSSRLHVESWSPEYGAPLELPEEAAPASPVDPLVETGDWSPITGSDRHAPSEVVFVEGVRRIEARLTLDHPDGPVPGLMAAFGVGAVGWDRVVRRSSFEGIKVHRVLAMAGGHTVDAATAAALGLEPESVPGDDPSELVAYVQRRMRDAEAGLASRLIGPDRIIVADGPISEIRPRPLVGFIKTHQVMYLGAVEREVIGRLRAGQRTPLFLIKTKFVPRYSWYLRLADLPHGHSWTGIARCEVAVSQGLDTAVVVAGWTAALLPGLASERHIDPRAPQNLVPIGALERELRRSMGDSALMVRALRAAVRTQQLAGAGSPA